MKQVIPRPALSRVALRVPVLSAGDDAVAVLEADMLRRNVTLSHLHEVAVRLSRISVLLCPASSMWF